VFIYLIFITYKQLATKPFFKDTSLEENDEPRSILLRSKMSGKEVALIFEFREPCYMTLFNTSRNERSGACSSFSPWTSFKTRGTWACITKRQNPSFHAHKQSLRAQM
jgi:hypothetical protein